MNEYDKRLDFDSDTFEGMKHDMNFVLQRLLGNMIEKQSTEGSMTIKIDVTMVKEFIPNYDPNVKGESREISKPQFKHKVTSAVKISDEKSGNLNNEMEMVMDEETGKWKANLGSGSEKNTEGNLRQCLPNRPGVQSACRLPKNVNRRNESQPGSCEHHASGLQADRH